MTDAVVAGREALARHSWDEAVEALSKAEQEEGLSPEDLRLLAMAAWWSGMPDEAAAAWERAYAASNAAGDHASAAYAALRLAELAMRRTSYSIAGGWVARAEHLLESEPESAVHAWLAFTHSADALLRRKDWDAAIRFADEAIELGRKHGNTDVQSIARAFKGSALVRQGRWSEGLALFDEATASAVSGELDPKTACDVYCNTISNCRMLADFRRAGEWTEEADRWMERQDIHGYRGACRLHRAELKRLRGAWAEAEQEVRSACRELEDFRLLDAVGAAYYELGELRLRMGDLAAAEEAFNRAYEFGEDPQPGLALLMLARGQVDEAAASIARSLSPDAPDRPDDLLTRVRLLPARVEIALGGGDLDGARQAVAEMERLLGDYDSPAMQAAASTSKGAVLLEEGRPDDAAATLRRAWRGWQDLELPYESARARMLLGKARIAAGDTETARLDLQAAKSVFQRLGAQLDLRAARALLGEDVDDADRLRATMTFMFTDIVTSTDLLGVIGDEAWEELLRWHDRELRTSFAQHDGEEIKHTGDGFFVAFRDAADGIRCAVDIQRRLADHRRDHGFAPSVRIGLHTAEATRQDDDYTGRGVHLAARVGDLGERDEIVATRATLESAGSLRYPVSEPRLAALKGIQEPVEVCSVDWH